MLTASDIQSMLKAEREDALGVTSSSLSDERKRALEYYVGTMNDMPSQDGQSSAISTDVADTIDGSMPGYLEIFASSEEVVRFEPVGPEDEDAAAQETDYVNHVFMQKNDGFLILHNFIKDALLSKLGVVKVYWDKYERQEQETYIGQPPEVVAILGGQEGVEIIENVTRPDDAAAGSGGVVHDITLQTKKSYACAKVEGVPPEQFGFSKRTTLFRDSNYCYHEPPDRTEADLIAQGYDKEQVKALPGVDEAQTSEARSRGEQSTTANAADTSMRPLRVTEHYIRMDRKGDGNPQLYRVTTGGDKFEILKRDGKEDIVRVDALPFAVMTPIIIPHTVIGRSLADLAMPTQKIKTALLRGGLNNVYLANNQRVEVAESHWHERTIDDLLTNRPGGVVRMKLPGGIKVIPNQSLGPFVFPMIQYMDSTLETRTGVTKQTQGIDADALQNQSATAVNQVFAAAQARTKMTARVFAETGVRDMFALLHATIRKNESKQNTVKLRNKWVNVDPRAWKTRDDMTINVGLGTGSKESQVMHLMTILGIQKEAIMAGSPIVTWKNIYNTVGKLIEKIDLKTVEPYFTDPEQNPQAQQTPPDPKMIEVQGKLQLQGQKQQADMAMTAQKLQSEAQLRLQQLQAEGALEIRQQDTEAQLERERMQIQAMLDANTAKMDNMAKREGNKLKSVQMGGKVG